MPAQKISAGNGQPVVVGPHPGVIALPMLYLSQEKIDRMLYAYTADDHERTLIEAKEDSLRLKGVIWLDNVRRFIRMPIATYTTACIYYAKFRLAHPPGSKLGDTYFYSDAAAASLLVACKSEETKKYSRDILAAVHNLKLSNPHERAMPDDPMFEEQSRSVIELERLILETIKFNFRDHNAHELLIKTARQLESSQELCERAWTIMTELYRTFAPLKHTSLTLSLAALELAAELDSNPDVSLQLIEKMDNLKLDDIFPSRGDVMEVVLDALDHYTGHTSMSILGPRYPLDKFLQIRLRLNKECQELNLPRYAKASPHDSTQVNNGHPTPVSPADFAVQQELTDLFSEPRFNKALDQGGTLRFAMNAEDALAERDVITSHLRDEYEDIEEEVEIQEPPRNPASQRSGDRQPPDRPRDRDRRDRHQDDRRRPHDERHDRRQQHDRRRGHESGRHEIDNRSDRRRR